MYSVKRCTRCGERKALDQFPPVRRGEPELQTWCRACFAENNARYYREHREAQKARLIRNTDARRAENKGRLLAYLSTHPCVDCGERDVVVLQFDHVRDKSMNISTLIGMGASWKRIEAEIAKCEVRCANCHRLRTARGWSIATSRTESAVEGRSQRRAPQQLLLAPALELRTCRVCGQTKTLAAFPFRSLERQTRQSICLACQRAYTKEWYARNRRAHIARVGSNTRRRRREIRSKARELRMACVDCGETNSILLDFDHLRDKRAEISRLIHTGVPWTAVQNEIDKCEVRCANCHARKTAREQGSYRTKVV
jgi:hypothetical protein